MNLYFLWAVTTVGHTQPSKRKKDYTRIIICNIIIQLYTAETRNIYLTRWQYSAFTAIPLGTACSSNIPWESVKKMNMNRVVDLGVFALAGGEKIDVSRS